jgi:hypothetical protein
MGEKMKKNAVYLLPLLMMIVVACSITSRTGTSPTPLQAAETPAVPINPTRVPPDPVPVSLNEGLNSLDSYQMTVMIKSTGPDLTQSSTTTVQRQRSNEPNASYTHFNTTSLDKGGSEPRTSDTEIYQIGNDQCSGSAEDWSWSSSSPAQAEMQGLVTSMIGLTPLIDAPAFVAVETVNGIPTHHFNFKVSGLGTTSGAVVNINQGDYWLAIDGQYIVKYILIVEESTAADAEVYHEEVAIEMTQINQPVSIAFPQACLDASQVTPTP